MSSRLFAASVAAVGNIVGSREIYPEKARELVDKALSSLSGNHLPVRCALLLATEAWCDPDDSVSARVREALKAKLGYEVPLIGGSTPRIYCSKSPTRIIDQGMVLVLLRSDDLWITVGSLANPYESEGKARQDRIGKFARDLRERAGVRLGIAAHRYLFGMLPGFRRNAQGRRIYRDNELLQEILAGFDHRYPLLGASAANAFIPERGFQFANDDCLVSGLALGFVENDLAAGTVMTHGLTRCTDKLVSVDELVDESGYLVGKMDGKPAAERLRELGEEFPNSALGNIIFGQPCDDDFHIILPILDSSNENGAVRLKRRVARGDRLHLLDATPDELHAATARAFDGAIRIACETHHELALVFGFSCIGRYHDFARRKPKWDEMVGRLAREYPPAPVVLSLCAGEFAVDEVRRPRSNNMSIWVSCFADRLAAHAQSRRLERTLVGAAEDLLACATAKQVMDKALKGAVAAGATGGQICIVDRKIGRIIGKGLGSALAAADSSHNWNEVAKLTDRKLTPRGVDELPHELEEFAMPVGTPVKASPAWQPQLSVAESPADDDILALIERTKYAIFVPDLPPGEAGRQAAKKFRCDPAAAAAGGIRCFLAIPLVGSGRSVIAALQLSFPDGTKLDREQFIAWIGYAQRIADILERVQESEERVILQRIADFANDLQHRRPTPDQGPTSWCQGYLRKVQDLLAADYVHMRVAQPDRAGELRLITPPTPLGRVHQATRPATHADDPYSGIPVMGSRIANTAAETQKFVALMTPQANEELWPELLRYFGEFQAAATFTLSDQTGVLGSFVIHSKQEYFLTERLRRMATVAADTAAALLRNQTQAYEYWRRTADHDFLEDLDSKLLDSPVPEDPEESRDWLRHVIEDLCQKFEADWGALFLADRAGERLILHTSYNWYAKNVEGKVEYRIREGWTGNVAVNSGDIISVLKDSHYRATQKYHDYIEPPEARGKPGEVAPRVGIRLMAGQVLIGVLTLGYYFRNLRRFNALDRLSLSLLKSFGRRLTLALAVIRQIQLKKQIKTLSQSKKGVTDRLLAALQSDKSGDWQTAFDSLRELFRVEVVGYFELRDELKLRWSSPSKHKILDATPSVDVYGILQDVLQTQKAQLIPPNDVGVALYAIPVQGINEDVIGALAFLSTAQYLDAFPQFDEVEKETASDVAQTLGLAISTQNELLRKLTQATTMGATAIAGMLTAHNIEVPVTRLTGAVDDLAEAVDTKAPGSLTQEMFDHAVKVAGLTDAVQELMDARLDNREDILKCCRMVQMEARKLITEIKENAELAGEVVEPLPLSELLNSALERALGDVSSPNVRPSVDQVPDVRISVNRWMFVSALRNLLVNGLEALSNTGELTVRTELHTTSEVAIIIHNSGPRYTQPQVRTFFEPRSDKPGRHLGLGLKLAKQVMERAHGTLEVYAPDSGGVEVKVTLPCKPS